MFKMLRRTAPAYMALSLTVLLGCGAPQATASNGATPPPGKAFSLDTPLDRIAADQRGKAVLVHDLPGLMASRSYILFDDMSLTQIASLSGGQLTQAKLDLVQADLAQLSIPTP